MSVFYTDWREVPTREWPWPNFSPEEIACKGSGALLADFDALCRLQGLRYLLGKPVHLNSAYRSEAHNKAVGGSPKSQHLLGRAFDIALPHHGFTRDELTAAARAIGFTGIGQYRSFVHVDTGPPRTWDHR